MSRHASQQYGRYATIPEETATDGRHRDEPRTMADNSFDEWIETMAGLSDSEDSGDDVSPGPMNSRIPGLTNRWAYENWLRRMVNPDFDPDIGGDTHVPVTQGSRIPVPVERHTYGGPSRIPAQPRSFKTPRRNIGYGHGRQEAPRRYQPYYIPAPRSTRMTTRRTVLPRTSQQYGRYATIPEETATDGRHRDEPRTMADRSFNEWIETMAGLGDSEHSGDDVSPGPKDSRIPGLTNRWAYENWLRRMVNPDFDPDIGGDTHVPVTQGSRIPVPVERQTYGGPSRIPAQPQSFRTSPRNIGYGHGRQEAPRRYQPYYFSTPKPTKMTTRRTVLPRTSQQYGRYATIPEETATDGRHRDEPRTMADRSFDEWIETMAGLGDSEDSGDDVSPGPKDSRIPGLTNRWAYENWMRRMVNPDFDLDVDGDTHVPVTQGSRIPVQPQSFRTSPTNMDYGHGRQEAPRRYQLYTIPASTSNSTTLKPRDCQCPVHCPKKIFSRVPIYPDTLAPSSSGTWQVYGLSDTRRSGIAARSAPRGTLKTAGGRRVQRQRYDRNCSQ